MALAGTGLGYYSTCRLQRHIGELEKWQRLIVFLEGRLRYTAAPVQEMLRAASLQVRGLEFLKESLSCPAEDFADVWERSIDRYAALNALTSADSTLWKEMGNVLGRSDRESQLSALELYARRLSDALEEARCEAREKGKLYLSLGVTGGMAAALLLL